MLIPFLGRVDEYLSTWENRDFNHHRFGHANFRDLASTWREQREMILDFAVAALEWGNHPLAKRARKALDSVWGRAKTPTFHVQGAESEIQVKRHRKVGKGETVRGFDGKGNYYEVAFDFSEHGSKGIEHLVFGKETLGEWDVKAMTIKGRGGLGGVEYRLYDDAEFRDFVDAYW